MTFVIAVTQLFENKYQSEYNDQMFIIRNTNTTYVLYVHNSDISDLKLVKLNQNYEKS